MRGLIEAAAEPWSLPLRMAFLAGALLALAILVLNGGTVP